MNAVGFVFPIQCTSDCNAVFLSNYLLKSETTCHPIFCVPCTNSVIQPQRKKTQFCHCHSLWTGSLAEPACRQAFNHVRGGWAINSCPVTCRNNEEL